VAALMTLGMFAFELATLPHDSYGRKISWSFAEGERVGARAATQFLGPGEDKVTISGAVLPGLAGSYSAIDTLVDMGGQGEAWPLLDGAGRVWGTYRIDGIDQKGGHIMDNGVARRVDFSIELTRVD